MAIEKTRAELITRVLDLLGVTASGNNPVAEDVQQVDAQLDAVLESLAAQSISYVANPEAVPLNIFHQLAVVIADAMDTEFGMAAGSLRASDGASPSKYDRAVAELRVINSGRPAYGPQKVSYF